MGTSLNGLTPAGTYPGLIKTGDNAPIDGTLKTLSDGNGNNLPMSVSTTTINLTGTAQVGGVAIANTTQVAAKQDTLVSGTNIKTINGTSVLGSGNIVTPTTNPSGVAGAIQFSNGSAFASDASNLFWDDTNNRLGIGTNAPTQVIEVAKNAASDTMILISNTDTTSGSARATLKVKSGSLIGAVSYTAGFGMYVGTEGNDKLNFMTQGNPWANIQGNGNFNVGNVSGDLGAKVGIKGSGSTSATTSLLVQNSSGTTAFQINGDNNVYLPSGNSLNLDVIAPQNTDKLGLLGRVMVNGIAGSMSASAVLQADSTNRGFLPPRMTTTQKNAIATPAAGLVVYDSTTNKLCCYNGSTWNDLF